MEHLYQTNYWYIYHKTKSFAPYCRCLESDLNRSENSLPSDSYTHSCNTRCCSAVRKLRVYKNRVWWQAVRRRRISVWISPGSGTSAIWERGNTRQHRYRNYLRSSLGCSSTVPIWRTFLSGESWTVATLSGVANWTARNLGAEGVWHSEMVGGGI